MQPIEHKQPRTDQQEQRELDEDHHAAGEECQLRFAQVLRCQHPLHHQLVGPMRRHGEEGPPEDACPKGVRRGQIQREVEHVELACRARDRVNRRPATRHMLAERPDGDQGPANINGHLDDVRPDDRGHSALEGIQQRQRGDDGDGQHVSGPDGDADHDGDGEDAHTLRRRAREQEQARGDLVERASESPVDELIGRQHLALKVLRQEYRRHHDPSQHVADYDLQESEIAREGECRRADDRQRTGLRGYNRQPNRPPRHRLVRQKISAQRLVFRRAAPGKPQPEKRNPDQVQPHHAEIERMQPDRHA